MRRARAFVGQVTTTTRTFVIGQLPVTLCLLGCIQPSLRFRALYNSSRGACPHSVRHLRLARHHRRRLTFDGVRVAAAAIGRFLREQQPAPAVLVGYDRRFFSEEFARAAADALAAEGVRVVLGDGPVPTPAVAAGIVARRLSGGVNITASHNPAEYSGVKFSDATGAPCSVEQARRIEALAEELAARPRRRRRTSAAPAEMADCARD